MTGSFWVILLLVLVYGAVHSALASLAAKARARHWFGPRADRWFRLLYNLVAGLTLLPVLALPVLLPDHQLYAVPFPWLLLMLAGQGLAAAALLVGVLQTGLGSFIGLNQLIRHPENVPPRLVTHGLYRYVRHPLYTAGLVFIWLLPVMSTNLLALNIGITLYLYLGALVEERKLLHEFGEPYAEYCRRTPMLVPGLRLGRR